MWSGLIETHATTEDSSWRRTRMEGLDLHGGITRLLQVNRLGARMPGAEPQVGSPESGSRVPSLVHDSLPDTCPPSPESRPSIVRESRSGQTNRGISAYSEPARRIDPEGAGKPPGGSSVTATVTAPGATPRGGGAISIPRPTPCSPSRPALNGVPPPMTHT